MPPVNAVSSEKGAELLLLNIHQHVGISNYCCSFSLSVNEINNAQIILGLRLHENNEKIIDCAKGLTLMTAPFNKVTERRDIFIISGLKLMFM